MFVAIGQIHKDNGDDQRPRHVGHYWPDYDPELARADPKPSTFVEYIFAGMGEAEKVSQSHPAVEKIAKGILRLAAMAEGGRIVHDRRYCHRYFLQLLEGDAKARKDYDKVLDRFAVRREAPTEEMWNDDRPRRIVREIAESIAKASLSGDEVTAFLSWPERQSVPTVSSIFYVFYFIFYLLFNTNKPNKIIFLF